MRTSDGSGCSLPAAGRWYILTALAWSIRLVVPSSCRAAARLLEADNSAGGSKDNDARAPTGRR